MLLHGATDSMTSYLPVLGALAGELRMVAMDLRGHGGSGHVTGAYRIRDHAADVVELLRDVVGEPCVLAGHSLGAMVATSVASRSPELVRGLFLEDPPFYTARLPALRDQPEYPIFGGLRELLRQHRESGGSIDALAQLVGTWPIHPLVFEGRSLLEIGGPEVVQARAESLHRLDVGILDAILDGSQFDGFDPDAALAAIAVPVHLLAGTVACGATIAPGDVERLAALMPRFTHRTLPGVGHFVHHTAPADYVAELRAFAARCTSPRDPC